MTSVSQTIDYTKKQYMHSSYRWMKLTPVGGSGQGATLNASSSTIVNFEIPNNVINLSQSKLVFDSVFGSGATGLVTNVDALGLSQFDRITLSTRSGVVLANCDNMGQFTHLITKLKTKAANLVDNPSIYTSVPVVGLGTIVGTAGSVLNGTSFPLACYPNVSSLNTTQAISSKKPYGDICKSAACSTSSIYRTAYTNTTGAGGNVVLSLTPNNNSSLYRIDGSFISTPFLENLHVITENKTGTSGAAGAVGGLAVSYQLPLGSIKDTLLEINKSLYFGDNLILSLSFNPTTKFAWASTAGADGIPQANTVGSGAPPSLTNGANPPIQWTPNVGAVVIVQATTCTLSNLALYVAVETDPIITSQLINKVNTEGFSITVPYVYCTKTPITLTAGTTTAAGSGSFAMQQRITRGYGQRLLRCYSAVFGAEGTGNQNAMTTGFLPKTIGDGTTITGNASVAGFTQNQHDDHPLSAYNSSLDGIRLQDFTLSAEDSTHYLVNEPYLRGSCILNVEQYKNQCLHIDSWTGNAVCDEDDTVDNGISLDADKTYGVTYTTLYNISSQTSKQHYLFFVVQRSLMIKGNQIMIV